MGTKEQEMFCQKQPLPEGKGTFFTNFYRHKQAVKMCCDVKEPTSIVKVVVSVARGDSTSRYWGWLESETGELIFIWPSKAQVDMCFPYGPEVEEKKGRGKVVRVDVRKV